VSEEQALAQAERQRAAVVVVAPYERDSGEPTGDLVFALAGIRGVLVRTCGTNALAADLAVEAGTGMRLPCFAGTGRVANGRARLGTLATAFAREVDGQGSLVDALQEGDAWPIHIERPASSRPARGSSAEDGKRRRRHRKRD
jgi:hypothetical protein